jgi:hypothetical protein
MEKIDVGDIVDVHFVQSESLFDVRVQRTPSDVGDSWSLINSKTGELSYVCLFERMDLRKKGESP